MSEITYTVGEPCPNEDEDTGEVCGMTLYEWMTRECYEIACPHCGVVYENPNPEYDW